jgi:nucleoside triphosphate pyrophosphatase
MLSRPSITRGLPSSVVANFAIHGWRRLAPDPRLWQESLTGTTDSLARMPAMDKLILASGSPRRRELLRRAGLSFEVVQSGVEEIRREDESARHYALRLAREKALLVSAKRCEAMVLAADTVVECEGKILEKPSSVDEARAMLRMLSARTHTVVTAFALARGGEIVEARAVESRVTFRTLGAAEIDAYIATGEPFDKAGAYGIQGLGGEFIAHVDGSRENVMGLPAGEVVQALRRHGF